MRDLILFACVTGVHLISTIELLVYTFGGSMARFDSGAPAGLTETLAGWLMVTLSFPLLTVLEQFPALRFPGPWGYFVFAANASLWGAAVVAARRRWRNQPSSRGRAGA
jgi:hypothetical protein